MVSRGSSRNTSTRFINPELGRTCWGMFKVTTMRDLLFAALVRPTAGFISSYELFSHSVKESNSDCSKSCARSILAFPLLSCAHELLTKCPNSVHVLHVPICCPTQGRGQVIWATSGASKL
ncbi:hypothetical protein Csa_006700 [Cucumis sativus]|uniref:Uncharacterized protein n=1 Tax=Cucumis sativus TaxID=3659 RepID=A0A0A0LIV7_CUCSA|nr:hypothetical protein Csa_006700 [Cucumis sativus]